MSFHRLRLLSVSLLLMVAGLTFGCSTTSDGPDPQQAEILWDEWGVPHIFAGSDESMSYAFGWAQAQAHGDLLLRLYGEARGRAAEYWGAEHLDSDRWVHTVGIPVRSEAWLAAQSDEARMMLEAFVAGVNDYAAAHPDSLDDSVEVVLPVVPADVLAQTQRSIHFTFMAHPRRAAFVRDQWLASRSDAQADFRISAPELIAGSNAWAVSPSRSESGHALLLSNPHLPWNDLFTFFEAQLTSPTMDAYGASFVGAPFLGIAFNDHLGWTHTVNTLDATDVYELTLADGGVAAGYVFDGEVKSFETSTVTLKVQGSDGSMSEEALTVRSSVHGPVFAFDDREVGGGALALRVAGVDQSGLIDQYAAMARATNLEEFEAAQSQLQMPMFTTMYADRDGRTMHFFGGRIPVRPQDVDYPWDAIVPGDTSATLWTETYSYEQLPKVVDPASGWLQNANDPPWTTTFPRVLDPDAFPKHVAPRFMHFRAQQSAQLLEEELAKDGSLSFEDFMTAKHSTEMEWAVRIVDDLEAAVAAHGDARAREAMAVLSAWDRRSDADSRGAVLFARLADRLGGSRTQSGDGWAATPWSADAPTETPDGLADPAAAARLLSAVAAEVVSAYGSLDVAWGDVYRLRVGEHDHPASGAPGQYGVFRVLGFAAADDGTQRAVAGDSYVAVVEFSDPVRARALLSYGNASQPGSRHVGDQLELLSRQELRPVWRDRSEVEERAVAVVSLRLPD